MNRGLKLTSSLSPISIGYLVAGVSPMNRGLKPRNGRVEAGRTRRCRSFPDE